jgi:excisionase family DNA binding protein
MRDVSKEPKVVANGTAERAEPDTLTIEETAKRLRIGLNSAYAGVKSGDIPSIRIGRRLLVPRAALEALLAAGQQIERTPERGSRLMTPWPQAGVGEPFRRVERLEPTPRTETATARLAGTEPSAGHDESRERGRP